MPDSAEQPDDWQHFEVNLGPGDSAEFTASTLRSLAEDVERGFVCITDAAIEYNRRRVLVWPEGARVRVRESAAEWQGLTGTVTDAGPYGVDVEFDEPQGDDSWAGFRPHDLEAIVPSENTAATKEASG